MLSRAFIAALGEVGSLGTQYSKNEYLNLKEARELLEKEMILKAFSRNKDNITRAAENLGISRPMEKLGIGGSRRGDR